MVGVILMVRVEIVCYCRGRGWRDELLRGAGGGAETSGGKE